MATQSNTPVTDRFLRYFYFYDKSESTDMAAQSGPQKWKEDLGMNLGEKIKGCRTKAGLSQEQLAKKMNVSRQAVTKWETGRGIPDIANLIALSEEFDISLDELLKEDGAVKKKIISDSASKKWHILVIVYLAAIVMYIAYFAIRHDILMIGFLVSTLFMLFFEVRIFIKEKRISAEENEEDGIGA